MDWYVNLPDLTLKWTVLYSRFISLRANRGIVYSLSVRVCPCIALCACNFFWSFNTYILKSYTFLCDWYFFGNRANGQKSFRFLSPLTVYAVVQKSLRFLSPLIVLAVVSTPVVCMHVYWWSAPASRLLLKTCDVSHCLLAGACDESKEGPFYTHMGAGYDVQSVRRMIEKRWDWCLVRRKWSWCKRHLFYTPSLRDMRNVTWNVSRFGL